MDKARPIQPTFTSQSLCRRDDGLAFVISLLGPGYTIKAMIKIITAGAIRATTTSVAVEICSFAT